MKCTTVIDKNRDEEVMIYAHGRTEQIAELERIARGETAELYGTLGSETVRIEPSKAVFFTVEDGRVSAVVGNKHYRLRERIYELEKILPRDFVKINQSCIANIKMIARFEATIGGALRVVFKNGESDFVSRRQLKHVKERIFIK